MGKVIQENATSFGDWAYLAIAKYSKKFQKYEQKVLKDENPENLHQMRVAMRSLRSAMKGFNLALDLPKNARQKKVGKIAGVLGELRDLDVLSDTLNRQYLLYLPEKESKSLQKVLKLIKKRRKKAFKKVNLCLRSNEYISLKKSLEKWLENPIYQNIAQVSIKHILADLLFPQIKKLYLDQAWIIGVELRKGVYQIKQNLTSQELDLILEEEGAKLHDLRKEAKKTRYQMELFTDFYGEKYKEYLKQIKEIQTVLGDLQDILVLKEFFTEILGTKMKRKMPFFNKLLQNNLFRNWSQWLRLQIQVLSYSNLIEINNILEEKTNN